MNVRLLSLLCALSVLTPISVFAADVASAAAEVSTQGDENDGKSEADKAKEEALTTKVSNIIQGLDLASLQHFTAIYANYTVLSTVRAIQSDVKDAVGGCASNNKSMETDLNTRHEKWSAALAPSVLQSETNINNMIIAQNYLPKEKFDDLFVLVDETRQKNSSEFEKTPVTTEDACKYLLGKMDETEKSLNEMLKATLVTYPDVLKKAQQ